MTPDFATLKTRVTPTALKKPLDLSEQFLSACFSPCGAFFFAGGMEGQLARWCVVPDTPEPELISLTTLRGLTAWVGACACLPDGKHIVAADSWGQLACWEFCGETSEPVWKIANAHDGWIRVVSVSPDGQTLATCGRDSRVVFWSVEGKKKNELAIGEDLSALRFAPDGKSIFVGSLAGKVSQWELATSTKLREFDATALFLVNRLQDVGGVHVLAISPDGTTLLAGGTQPSTGGNVQGKPTVLAFNIADGSLKKKAVLGVDNDVFVSDIEWHTDGCWLISTSGNPGQGKLLGWRVEDEQPLFDLKLTNAHVVRRHPAGWLAVLTTPAGNGNGRQLDKNGEYPGNRSPLALFTFPV